MSRTTLKDLADRVIDGGLEDWLRSRKATTSLDDMAQELERDHEITVTRETVRSWCREYGIPTKRPAPEAAA